jgi:pimeloyl-ACP methyl ester carboxylesterase
MGRTAPSTLLGFLPKLLPPLDVEPDLPNIACPTLVITTEGSALGSGEATRAWQRKIPNSELLVLPGDSYHVGATHAEACAAATIAFIERYVCRSPAATR